MCLLVSAGSHRPYCSTAGLAGAVPQHAQVRRLLQLLSVYLNFFRYVVTCACTASLHVNESGSMSQAHVWLRLVQLVGCCCDSQHYPCRSDDQSSRFTYNAATSLTAVHYDACRARLESLAALFDVPSPAAAQLLLRHPALAAIPPNVTITRAKQLSIALRCSMARAGELIAKVCC